MTAKEKQVVAAGEAKKDGVLRQEMQAVIGDPDAKYIGPAKGGGKWFKNHKSGALYRVDKGENGYEIKETSKAKTVSNVFKKTRGAAGPTRSELMDAVRAKNIKNFRVMNKAELAEILKSGTTPNRIKEIQETAVNRWKSGWKFQDKKAN